MKKTRSLGGLAFGAGLLALCAFCGCSEPIPIPEDKPTPERVAPETDANAENAAKQAQNIINARYGQRRSAVVAALRPLWLASFALALCFWCCSFCFDSCF